MSLRKLNMELTLKDGYYIDNNNNNKWNVDKYTLEQASKMADTLIDCEWCIDCVKCEKCNNCI